MTGRSDDMPQDSDAGFDDALRDALRVVAEHARPLEVGRLELDGNGALRERASEEPLRFQFHYRDVPFDAEVGASEDSRLHLSARLGHLPFTAESPIGRRAISDLIAKAGRFAGGSLGLAEDRGIVLVGSMLPPKPRTPVSIMATVTALILEMRPRLDFVRECLVAWPAGLDEAEDVSPEAGAA